MSAQSARTPTFPPTRTMTKTPPRAASEVASSDASVATARRRLRALRLLATALCAMMFFWVLVSPGSCVASAFPESGAGVASRLRGRRERVAVGGVSRVVPPSLIAKFRAHPAVCASHVLPSALWSALVPTQLFDGFRRRFPRAHRVAGRVVVFVVVAMSAGYVAIHRRRLHFYANDFPSLAEGDAMSLVAPGAWRALGRAVRAIAGTRPDSDVDAGSDATRDGFAAFEHAAAAWFAWTALATVWIAARRKGTTWIDAHRAWATRHVGAGLAVAAQRAALRRARRVSNRRRRPGRVPIAEDAKGHLRRRARVRHGGVRGGGGGGGERREANRPSEEDEVKCRTSVGRASDERANAYAVNLLDGSSE